MKESQNLSDLLKIQKDLLWGAYQEHLTTARHNETLRSTVNNILIAASVLIITLTTFDRKIDTEDSSVFVMLIIFGLFGTAFNLVYTERYDRHRTRAYEYRKQLDKLFFSNSELLNSEDPKLLKLSTLEEIKEKADNNRHRYLKHIRKFLYHNILWALLPLFITTIGIYYLIMLSFFSSNQPNQLDLLGRINGRANNIDIRLGRIENQLNQQTLRKEK